jgi:hypothetical protein
MKYRTLALVLVLALPLELVSGSGAEAQNAAPAQIEVMSPWARATPAGAESAAAYMTMINNGQTADRLVAVSTPVAAVAEMHRTVNDNGVMKMLPVDGVDLHAGAQAVFKPGGYHVMLTKLARPLEVGQSFPMTLTFEKAGPITVTVKVQKVGAMGDAMGNMQHDMGGAKTE